MAAANIEACDVEVRATKRADDLGAGGSAGGARCAASLGSGIAKGNCRGEGIGRAARATANSGNLTKQGANPQMSCAWDAMGPHRGRSRRRGEQR